ncbi:uncharacterized protein G2W53_003748 [Senna tora]|uniref:Uncharacterized protein n=1 Tax=Senna tora TaxID=362788 RepID=A0A834XAN9_9FABA|nr:uncharacterized protein G2W53_003748 [Senna tora]
MKLFLITENVLRSFVLVALSTVYLNKPSSISSIKPIIIKAIENARHKKRKLQEKAATALEAGPSSAPPPQIGTIDPGLQAYLERQAACFPLAFASISRLDRLRFDVDRLGEWLASLEDWSRYIAECNEVLHHNFMQREHIISDNIQAPQY